MTLVHRGKGVNTIGSGRIAGGESDHRQGRLHIEVERIFRGEEPRKTKKRGRGGKLLNRVHEERLSLACSEVSGHEGTICFNGEAYWTEYRVYVQFG